MKHKYFINVGRFGWDYELVRVKDEKIIQHVQSDWEYPSLASLFGWRPCCNATDGTIDCKHRTVSQHLAKAQDYLDRHEGEIKILDLE